MKGEQGSGPDSSQQFGKYALKQVPWGLAGALIVVILGVFMGELIGTSLVGGWLLLTGRFVDLTTLLDAASSEIPLLFSTYLLSQLILATVVFKYVHYRGGSLRDLGFRKFKASKAAWIVVVGFIGFLLTAVGFSFLVEEFFPRIDVSAEQQVPFADAQGRVEIMLAFLAITVIAPITEELVFRGLLLPATAKAFGVPVAVIITSVLFGLLHPPAIAMVTIGVFGLFLSWAYIRGLSLWPAIILHSAKNLIAFISIIGVGL